MAKEKGKVVETANKEPKLKTKSFKLGEGSTLFVDPTSRKKIANKQVVEFNDWEMSTDKFKAAKKGGHIVEADAEDIDADGSKTVELEKFMALPTKEAKAKFIKEEYELSEAEEIEVDGQDENQLLATFKEWEDIED